MLLFFSELAAETLLRLLSEEGLCDAQSRGPTILQKSPDECIVTIEDNEVARCNSLEDAFLALASSVYIFNQAVPKKIRGFMWLMARFVMGLPAEKKPSAEAVSLSKVFGQ